ncbi:MAG: c-type cytochrome domain-containing protein [Lysobacterales bacterium]
MKLIRLPAFVGFALSVLVAGLYPDLARAASGCADLSGTAIIPNVSWQLDIKPMINEVISMEGRCTSCHSGSDPPAGLDLSDENIDAIYKIVGGVVMAGDPGTSILFNKVNCETPDVGSQMPLGGAPYTIAQRELIYDWIEQGAQGEDPNGVDGPIFRDFVFRDGGESIRFMRLP